jgi:uncharacterized protein YxjI
MRQKLISIGDDYWIEDASGEKVAKIQERKLSVRDK